MKFDTIIIGGGLAGLVCGISLSKQGQRCVIISSGQSALHFSSGSFDLLNVLPDGTKVAHPQQAVKELVARVPGHPYAKLGAEKFTELTGQAERFFEGAGIRLEGSALKNHYRVTPMGTLKPAWLTLEHFMTSKEGDRLPWKKIAVFNVSGFLDFYTQFIVDEFRKMGTDSSIHWIRLTALENLRKNPSEMRSTNIARLFDRQENLEELAGILRKEGGEAEAIVLPAILGLSRENAVDYLQQQTGKPVYLLPTLPPSVPGIQTQQHLRKCFQQAGGVYMLGDTVLRAVQKNNRIECVYSANHGDIPFTGRHMVLATGSFFSQGLIADSERVYEPVFGLDVRFPKERELWYEQNVFAGQPYQSFGVETDSTFRGMRNGQALENLYVTGAVLGGFNPVKEGCGAGVSVLSALYVAEQILSK